MANRARPAVVLASASAGRLRLLQAAGIDPEVVVSGVDETVGEVAVLAERDPGNVIGLSLPLLRRMLADLGVPITDLWRGPDGVSQADDRPDIRTAGMLWDSGML